MESVNGKIIAMFEDVESGTHRNRPGLWQAIDFCKEHKCTLIVAKLDRLSRDVEFTFKVINEKIDIYFCDMPVVNTMILGVFAAVAQYERELTSQRTKAALAERKKTLERDGEFVSASGNVCTSLGGTTNGSAKGGKVAGERRRADALENSTNRIVWEMLKDAATPQDVDRVAEKLNAMKLTTTTGLPFTRNRLTALRTAIRRRLAN